MKVILLRDVAKVGRKGQLAEVPSGHAINFLIPRKLVVPATPENLKRHTQDAERHTQDIARTQESFRHVLATLAQKPVTYSASANEQGNLFKGIHASDVVTRLAEEGLVIDVHAVVLKDPIKNIGTHIITLKQGGDEGSCTLEVIKK